LPHVLKLKEKIESLTSDLPDREGARLFFERLAQEHPRDAERLARNEGLFSDALALAAWSPLLATTLSQNPAYIQWLARERQHTRVKTREELQESLARFHLTHSQLEPQVLLARFRRRELLRIYLHDIRKVSTLVEVTEELSNLADAVLEHALSLARQELDNRYGPALKIDEKGRVTNASFCIVALGKLGSGELNYASDIDLLFLYSDDGLTSGKGTRGETTNREYFVKLAETVARTVGKPSGEGAAYRVDLRLRPHGRDGALASSLDEAVRYYRETAQAWERQTLIRARAAAGSQELYAQFNARVTESVYAADVSVSRALGNVRLAKQKIDRHHAHDSKGFNVKLGRGGIREIEFIAQALQLAFGGRDEWLRAPHTLISLGRLADRKLITERERMQLSEAYDFLRTLEHRLQMEHGLQTHVVPDEETRRTLFARRMNFSGDQSLADFDHTLDKQTADVRAAYDRIFGEVLMDEPLDESFARDFSIPTHVNIRAGLDEPVDALKAATHAAAAIFAPLMSEEFLGSSPEQLAQHVSEAADRSLNPQRALMLIQRIASSLDKSNVEVKLNAAHLDALVRLCGASEFFGELIAGHPSLINAIAREEDAEPDYSILLKTAVEKEETFRTALSALRRVWSGLLVHIGMLDAAGTINMRESNRRQTLLAAASLDAGCLAARMEIERRYGKLSAEPELAVLGLGRLGGGGMDYGSDLDVVLIYEDEKPSPIAALNHAEFYSRLSELLVSALSSLTREGHLYRVDLRLRPDGRNGQTSTGARAFINYLSERALAWEWLAYVKLRAVAGAISLGQKVEDEARRVIHDAARRMDERELRAETRRVRERLEREKKRRRSSASIDIKYGQGGMLDVYFATRYLQLRDNVPDKGPERSTVSTLEKLHAGGSLNDEDFAAMSEGYSILRTLDHHLRLIIGRSTHLHASDHPAVNDIARRMNYPTANALTDNLTLHMSNIRAAYDRVMGE
jgi:glutamate-ammonia-ligase adenylyltransferase